MGRLPLGERTLRQRLGKGTKLGEGGEDYITGDEDFGEQLLSIKESQPDVLFLPNYPRDILVQVKQARQAGIAATLLGNDTWTVVPVQGNDEFEGAYHTQHWHPGLLTPAAQEFIDAYRRRYGQEPSIRAALSYDAAGLLFEAIRNRNSTDGRLVSQGLERLKDYPGVTGSITYQEGSGDPAKGVILVRIRNGHREFYRQIDFRRGWSLPPHAG